MLKDAYSVIFLAFAIFGNNAEKYFIFYLILHNSLEVLETLSIKS